MSPAKSATKKTATKASQVWSAEEKAAMRQHAKEMKASAEKADAEQDVLDRIASMKEPDRAKAKRIHAIVKANAPELAPKLWYGMPAYARDGKIICFFQDAQKFKTRYATLGFNDSATLDEGSMWPVAFAVMDLTAAEEARIAALVKKAVS